MSEKLQPSIEITQGGLVGEFQDTLPEELGWQPFVGMILGVSMNEGLEEERK